MKDVKGLEVMVGDHVQHIEFASEKRIVTEVEKSGNFSSECGIGGCYLSTKWVILRRADGSVPESCAMCLGGKWQATTCSQCGGTGSIDRKPETKEQPMSEAKDKPVDKWGREMRAGDLLRVGLNEPFTMIRAVSKWNGPRGNGPRGMEWAATIRKMSGKEADWIRADGTRWEILSRGSPADLVPDTFTPERDAEGRPVLSDEVYYAQPREVTAPGRIEKSDVNYGEGASLASTPKPEDFHTRYLAFDKRVREIVAEEAPRAKVVVDRCGTSIVGWLSQEGHEVCCSDPMDQILLEGSEELLARDFASRLLFELRLALGDRELGKR